MKLVKIRLDQIDLSDERYRMSPIHSLERIKLSLLQVGLLQPPLVRRRKDKYLLVSGWKRVLACRELSLSPIEVSLVGGKDDLSLFLLAFHENLACRDFSPIEKAESVSRLIRFGETAEGVRKHYLPLLALHPTISSLETLLAIGRFSPGQKAALEETKIPFSSLERLAGLSSDEREIIIPWLAPLGLNKQKEFLDDLVEISRRDSTSLREILGTGSLEKGSAAKGVSALQRSEAMRRFLREKRFPTYSRWLARFESVARKIPWPTGASVRPSTNFEGDEISLTVDFRSPKEFRSCLARLGKAGAHPAFSELFLESPDV